ncbi:putative protein serine/threonine kinase [Cavenderia fasciculata]|uniref:Protein kinase domain-containing protein n=1 Tax=Cavenderia fasciculata TaxID=261658 RepID=F4Q6E0_CACFS|nr:putative protein serine/threonine kinase [Cavenderia fasciculata]EGG16450.1 putative protein serine/threonine kinase [Cavenderia fasciculata]|eukprot:XP_004354850.1 putative protein serine/threonine kinase [Cavenderia fasciculata]
MFNRASIMTIPDTMKGTTQNETIGEKKEYLHLKENTNNPTSIHGKSIPYEILRIVGQGTFGKVYEAKNIENKRVAIKKVEKSTHFISREYDILRIINHPNCLKILDMYFTSEDNKRMQNLVFDFIPYTLATLLKKKYLSINFVKVLFYQLCLAIKHIHSKNICHRDITPNNILLNIKGELVLADFGSAKILEANHTSMSYICSRYYRAPELLVGCANYTTKIDIWSIGCILAEMLLGKPIFPGTNSMDQLIRISEILGNPSQEDWEAMRPNKAQMPPGTPNRKLDETFSRIEDKEVIDLLSKIFLFDPTKRASIDDILAHPFLHGVNLANLEQFDEMKCFTKAPTSSTSTSSSSTASNNTGNLANSTAPSSSSSTASAHTNKENMLSRMSSVVTSSTNLTNNISLNTSSSGTNKSNTNLSTSNNAVIGQPPLTINTT